MNAEVAVKSSNGQAAILEKVLIGGDLTQLSNAERVNYYSKVCDSMGLNPLTKPFDYIKLNGKLTLYAKRDATDQLRKLHAVSIESVKTERFEDVFVVTASAKDRDGRTDSATGVVAIGGLKGDNLANAIMKAETKAKRRVTLSIVGLGWLDETEIETIPDAKPVPEPQPEVLPQESPAPIDEAMKADVDAVISELETLAPGDAAKVLKTFKVSSISELAPEDQHKVLDVLKNRIALHKRPKKEAK